MRALISNNNRYADTPNVTKEGTQRLLTTQMCSFMSSFRFDSILDKTTLSTMHVAVLPHHHPAAFKGEKEA
jgi:hypothetical protein